MDEKKQAERQGKKIQDSTEYYKHADAKPGSNCSKKREWFSSLMKRIQKVRKIRIKGIR